MVGLRPDEHEECSLYLFLVGIALIRMVGLRPGLLNGALAVLANAAVGIALIRMVGLRLPVHQSDARPLLPRRNCPDSYGGIETHASLEFVLPGHQHHSRNCP